MKIISCCPLMMKEPILMDGMSTTLGNVRCVGDTNYILVYYRKNDTPIAVINRERRGALRSGL